jgi:antibiotic biosynthesis monooxygenase (ABM) superfamily enzyme
MKPPSIHVRAFITWLAIYPLVLIVFFTVLPLMGDTSAFLKVLVLTLIVIPTAVYLVVPNLMKVYFAIVAKRAKAQK